MDDTKKNETGSGSDVVSAAKISAGSSVGAVGQTPTPPGSSATHSAQSKTLASHTSQPMGGTGGTGASRSAGSTLGQNEQQRHQDKDAGVGMGGQRGQSSGQGGSSGVGDQAGDLYRQASERAGQTYEQATEWARDTYEQAADWASDTFSRDQYDRARRGASQGYGSASRFMSENPVMVGVIGLAAGLLIGALLPRTRREDETFGRWSDEVRDQGMRYAAGMARDMTERGRRFVEEGFTEEDTAFARHESELGGQGAGGQGAGGQGGTGGPGRRYQNH